jgi:hypothetical protein
MHLAKKTISFLLAKCHSRCSQCVSCWGSPLSHRCCCRFRNFLWKQECLDQTATRNFFPASKQPYPMRKTEKGEPCSVNKARTLLESSQPLCRGVTRSCKATSGRLRKPLRSLELELADTESDVAGAIKIVKQEVVNARALLKLKQSTSLQQGIEDMQTALSQATEVVKKAQKSLKLAERKSDVAGAIDKVQKEIVDARALLELQESTSLQQNIEGVVQQLPKELSRTSGNLSSLSLVSPFQT